MAATRARVLAAQAEAARLETRTWTGVLIALGSAVGLALFGTAVISRRMTRSLDRLSSATVEIATSAFQEPIAVESRDEIGALARSFKFDGEPAASHGGDEARVLRGRLTRASIAHYVDPRRHPRPRRRSGSPVGVAKA